MGSFTESLIYQYMLVSVGGTVALIMCIVFVVECYHTITAVKEQKRNNTTTIILILVTYSASISHKNIINVCDEEIPFMIYLVPALLDQIVTFTVVYLFIKPIIYLIKIKTVDDDSKVSATNATDTVQSNTTVALQKEYQTIVKVAALSFIASITTFLVLISAVIAPFSSLQFAVDMGINALCILLMNSGYSKLYTLLCCGTNKICQKFIICLCCLQPYIRPGVSQSKLSNYIDRQSSASPQASTEAQMVQLNL
eukprot:243336_1